MIILESLTTVHLTREILFIAHLPPVLIGVISDLNSVARPGDKTKSSMRRLERTKHLLPFTNETP